MPAHRTRETSSRTLEVSTDAPLPPTVAIISPTPRALHFPINSPDVRFASPSSSPFELDHKPCTPPPPRPLSPTSSIGSEASSILSTPSARSSQASHKRRRSTASDIVERRPKKGDEDYIKRPENAFILFRRKCCEDRQAKDEAEEATGPVKRQRQADLSKTISQQWKTLPAEERLYWEELAKEKKKEHEAMYPNYVYRPQRVKDKAKAAKKGKSRRADGEPDTDAESSISFVLPVPSPPRSLSRDSLPIGRAQNRRAASAPTPPPAYQTIQLPTVYMPSCPTSPSLNPLAIPRISRRPTHIPPPTDSDPLTHYEYLPHDSLFPPPFNQSVPFEPNQATDQLFQQMFQLEQPALAGQVNGPILHSLSIPREPSSLPPSLMSPAESVASSQFLSPVDHFTSPVSPSSPQGGPFTPVDSLSMMSLSLANNACGQQIGGMPDNAGELAYSAFTWPDSSLWSAEDMMIPDDFDLNSIPPIELGLSQYDSEMQHLSALSASVGMSPGFELEGGDFPALGQEHDLHEANPGHDPFAIFDDMNW
ncbi:uncharacterized protein FIBRA_08093 [Fibroporia radiculosa]|uniref:HMG box domain-containing protein n=1 Tax=Fibroporia radiculosa TaxID=599839 RepID=J4I247_9APHY|nr:uncharacterized protein FIBRA_08093 [Fibroporia radiculosa]CCM05857.1 predicted protein [Fibroporia radiculosa]